MLSDFDIRKELGVGNIKLDPTPVDGDIQPASIDVHLGNHFRIEQHREQFSSTGRPIKGPRVVRLTEQMEFNEIQGEVFLLMPGQFALGVLAERLTLSDGIVARIEGKSSIGRHGLAIHVTAGFVDPGWDGHLTIELVNQSGSIIELHAGDPIGQLAFDYLTSPAVRPYGHPELGSHYQGATTAEGAKHG